MYLDVFTDGLTTKQVDTLYINNLGLIIAEPHTVKDDGGKVVGYQIKCDRKFYDIAIKKHPGKIFLWHNVSSVFKREGKFARHIFGPGNPIVDSIDPDNPLDFVSFKEDSTEGYAYGINKKYKIDKGKLVEDGDITEIRAAINVN